jgi:hypothetical protein
MRVQRIALRSSPRLGALLAVAHAGSAACAVLFLPPVAAACAFLALWLSLVHAWQLHVRRSDEAAVVALELGTALQLVCRNGCVLPATVASRFIAPGCVVLTALPHGGRRCVALVILPDAAGGEGHRRLRTWLAWQPAVPGAAREPNA